MTLAKCTGCYFDEEIVLNAEKMWRVKKTGWVRSNCKHEMAAATKQIGRGESPAL